jgi:hypothetical protein
MYDQDVVARQGFFASLFDLSFSSLVTKRLVKLFYALGLLMLGLVYLGVAIGLFTHGNGSTTLTPSGVETHSSPSPALGVLWLTVIGPLVLFVNVVGLRVVAELVTALFGIFENTRDQLAVTRAALAAAGDGQGA